jgi:hypothetical protein
MTDMDWSNYPAPEGGLTGESILTTPDDLAAFLGGDIAGMQANKALFDLLALAALTVAPAVSCLSVCYPREVTAWQQWDANKPLTVDELLVWLASTPDPAQPAPGELVPVQLDRLQVSALGPAINNLIMRYRQTSTGPIKTLQQTVASAGVEIDPIIIASPTTPARVSVLVTVAEVTP